MVGQLLKRVINELLGHPKRTAERRAKEQCVDCGVYIGNKHYVDRCTSCWNEIHP